MSKFVGRPRHARYPGLLSAWHTAAMSRRAFLRHAVAVGAGLAALPWHTPATPGPAHAAQPAIPPASTVTLARWHRDAVSTWQQQPPAPTDPPATRRVLLSPEAVASVPCHAVIPSWAAHTPPGTWLEIQMRAFVGGRWTRFYPMMRWDSAAEGSRRTSFPAQPDHDGDVSIDTLTLHAPAERVQARVLLCSQEPAHLPTLHTLTICMAARQHEAGCMAAPVPPLPQTALLQPPLFSQYDYVGGEGWCSPTSLAMVLGYWHYLSGDARLAPFIAPDSVPTHTAPMVYDPHYRGNGNWPFNTAYAASLGLDAYVTRFADVAQLAGWIDAGVPVMCSLAWQPGQLDNASGTSSDGHLIVVVGVRSDGWVEVADPSGTGLNGGIRRAYRADQFTTCWQCSSGGTVYLIHPHSWETPILV